MITNKQILTEVEQLSRLFKDGKLIFLQCGIASGRPCCNVLATIMAYRHV